MHKRYMIVTKLVDMIEETLMHDAGIDLYERGGNISLSNLRYHVSPVFCGKPRFESLLAGFVDMVRTQTPETKYRFFAAVRDAYDNCTDAQYKTSLSPYIHAEECIDDILDGIDFLALDPAIPSFFLHCIEWGKQLGGEFIAIHDASKPMAAQKTTFEAMMDKSITPALIGYDRRKFEFPLKAKKLQFADSKDHLAIQVADLFAEATAYSMSAFTRPDPDSFVHQLGEAGIGRFLFEALWPTKLISPEDLGTTEIGGINTIDHITKTLNKKLF